MFVQSNKKLLKQWQISVSFKQLSLDDDDCTAPNGIEIFTAVLEGVAVSKVFSHFPSTSQCGSRMGTRTEMDRGQQQVYQLSHGIDFPSGTRVVNK